ncbi:MAG: hypothetical protein M0Z27_10500 [Thermaerobacter sp.]|nr:hypothetical protein [Thermaerobacter sp.]
MSAGLGQGERDELRAAVLALRNVLERDVAQRLEGDFGLHLDGKREPEAQLASDPQIRKIRHELEKLLEHEEAKGLKPVVAVERYRRETAYTWLNRLVALRLLEERGEVPESVRAGDASRGFRDFRQLHPDECRDRSDGGYAHYLLGRMAEQRDKLPDLFNPADPASLVEPSPAAMGRAVAILNDGKLAGIWRYAETLGWTYQYFNAQEKEKVRDAGKPTRSEDLTVTTQFYTPDYVVRFLVDNTLGWLWRQMHPESGIAQRCSLLLPDRAGESRPAKDPRQLRVIDPAVGSGHFLLYAFDVFATIYEEAGFPREEIPGLILGGNLFGVDIDPRAVQLAGVALHLKAAAYHPGAPFPPAQIVWAEAAPREPQLLNEVRAELGSEEARRVFDRMWRWLPQADELGSLLRPAKLLGAAVDHGHRGAADAQERFDFHGDLARQAETRIRGALERLTEGSDGMARRRFAAEGEEDLRLLRMLSQDYDVVLMNPPYGEATPVGREHLREHFPRSRHDLYAAFVERGLDFLRPGGYLGAITPRNGFFLGSFEDWREMILERAQVISVADLGFGVLDGATVETAAYVLEVRK